VSNPQCFLNLSVANILSAQYKTIDLPWTPSLALTELPWEPVLDEDYVPDQPLNLFKQGKSYPVPAIFGNVRNETLSFGLTVFQLLNMTEVTPLEYFGLVGVFFQSKIFDVIEHYPVQSNSSDPILNLTNDYLFTCPTRNLAIYHSKAGNPTYLYHFLWSSPDDIINHQWVPCRQDGNVCHASELTFVFCSGRFYGPNYHTASEQQFSLEVLEAWASFAHGTVDEIKWPQFNNSTLLSKGWDINPSIEKAYNQVNCDFWDSMGYDG